MYNVLGSLKFEVEDLKNNAGKYIKVSEDPLLKNAASDENAPVGTNIKQLVEEKLKSAKKELEGQINQWCFEFKNLEAQQAKFEEEFKKKTEGLSKIKTN